MVEEDLWNIVNEVLEDVNFEELNVNENASDDNGYCSDQSVNSDQIINATKDALNDNGYNTSE